MPIRFALESLYMLQGPPATGQLCCTAQEGVTLHHSTIKTCHPLTGRAAQPESCVAATS